MHMVFNGKQTQQVFNHVVIEYCSSKRNTRAFSYKGEKFTHFLSAFRGEGGGSEKADVLSARINVC